jgi:hypothetical protein
MSRAAHRVVQVANYGFERLFAVWTSFGHRLSPIVATFSPSAPLRFVVSCVRESA